MSTNSVFILILFTGMLTSITDLTYKQIKNQHLIVIAILGIAIYIYALITVKIIPVLQMLSLVVAIAIAILLYVQQLWRPGDAKLFILYSFLMPATGYETATSLPFPCLFLFANTFILGLVLHSPEFVRIVAHKHKELLGLICSRDTLRDVYRTILVTFGLSWIIFPILTKLNISQYGFVSFLVIAFFLTFCFDAVRNSLQKTPVFLLAVIAGAAIRYAVYPQFFSWLPLCTYFAMLLIYSVGGLVLNNLTQYIADAKERVPFAPILAGGCLLSYTPFLMWFVSILARRSTGHPF